MIDLHAHVLPGLDDGARTLEESLDLARRAAAEGVTAMAATPHVRYDYPTTPEQMESGVAELRRALGEHGIPLDILPGGEIDLAELQKLGDDDLRRFSLAGGGAYLLVEFPYHGWPFRLEHQVHDLQGRGLRPVLAHPERNREVQANPARLEEAVRVGALVQVTAASVEGRLGRSSQAAAQRLAELGLVHLLASDAHTPDVRAFGLAAALTRMPAALRDYLVHDVPAAILAGKPVLEPPEARPSRRGLRWLSRRR